MTSRIPHKKKTPWSWRSRAARGLVYQFVALLVVLLTVIVGSFDGDVLQPLVMGKAVSLNGCVNSVTATKFARLTGRFTLPTTGTSSGNLKKKRICTPCWLWIPAGQ